MIKKIAILTSGGDAPGMNNAIRSVVNWSKVKKIESFLVFEGYKGLYNGDIVKSSEVNLDDTLNRGGTIIYSARFPEFKNIEIRKKAKKQLDKLGIDALVVIGGDGSYKGAQLLHELGVKTIALPGTIDNDINSTDLTIGFSTALNTITENVERIRDTMTSHNRVGIIEVMGHGCSDLGLFTSIAVGADLFIPDKESASVDEIVKLVNQKIHIEKKRTVTIIVSEFTFENIKCLEKTIFEKTNVVTRTSSLGHLQRGGRPSAFERINASLMGMKAVDLLVDNKSGLAIGYLNGEIKSTPILEALSFPKKSRKKLIKKINKLNQI